MASCSDVDTKKAPYDRLYFPLTVGLYHIYTVEGVTYKNQIEIEPFSYELKTEVVDSFRTVEGDIQYVIYRSKRDKESDAWEYIDTWSARINSFEAVQYEGNVPFVKIDFPVFKNKQWNGNAFNSLGEEMYTIDDVGSSYRLTNGNQYNNCLSVNQFNYSVFDRKDDRKEIYAEGIGLIYYRKIKIDYCDDTTDKPCICNGDCLGQLIPRDGIEYFQELKEYGTN